jgi:integrase/recombinase XerD
MSELTTEQKLGPYQKRKSHQFWQLEFIKNCQLMNRSAHTLKNYNADLDKFFIWYESHYYKLITKMSAQIITEYKEFLTHGGEFKLRKKIKGLSWLISRIGSIFQKKSIDNRKITQIPLAVASRKRHLSTLKNFFEFLKQTYEEKDKHFLKNPVKPKLHNIKLKDIDINHTKMLCQEDWNILNENIQSPEDRLLIQLMYYGGLRLHEVCNLKKEDIDFENRALHLNRKGGKRHRLIPYQKSEIFYLSKILLQKYPATKYLFSSKSNFTTAASVRTMHSKVKRIFINSGLKSDLTAHSFRKACATNYYLRTKDLILVRDYLNHLDAKVTQTYIDSKTLAKRDCAQRNNGDYL